VREGERRYVVVDRERQEFKMYLPALFSFSFARLQAARHGSHVPLKQTASAQTHFAQPAIS
jgi:hypothetical protein